MNNTYENCIRGWKYWRSELNAIKQALPILGNEQIYQFAQQEGDNYCLQFMGLEEKGNGND